MMIRRYALLLAAVICGLQMARPAAQTPEQAAPPQGGAAQAPAPQRGAPPQGAGAAAAPARGIAVTTTSHTVANLERTVAFYRGVFGFDLFGAVGRPLLNATMEKLTNTTGARYRQAALRLPNTGLVVRLMEFSGIEHGATQNARLTDPGQVALRLFVTDMEPALANLRR